jgi:hypothetical protein
MSDVIRLNDHRDGFAQPVIEEFLRTGLLPPNLRDEMLRSMDEQEAEWRQVLREAIEYLRTRHNDDLCIQGVGTGPDRVCGSRLGLPVGDEVAKPFQIVSEEPQLIAL